MKHNFNQIEWGSDEGKGDVNLAHYFMKIPDYDKIIGGEKRYIIGRKGTGKTAILEKIRLDSEKTTSFLVRDLTLRDFPLNDIRGFRDKGMQDKSQFVPIWTFLIIIEICKLIIKDENAGNYLIKNQIDSILKENNLEVESGFVETIKILKNREAKFGLSSIFGFLGIEGSRSKGVEFEAPVHFTKALDKIKEILSKISSSTTYFILFDELDEGFNARDSNKRLLLLSLFRAVENLCIDFKKHKFSVRPIVALRSDIYESLEDNDLNKYDDYLIKLNWVSDTKYSYSLRELVNTRIRYSLNVDESKDAWLSVCEDINYRVPTKSHSVWMYMKNRTFERPRDIIKFLKYCKDISKKESLKFEDVRDAEDRYSNWFYNEIRDEIQSFLPVWKESLSCLTKIGKGILTTSELLKALESEKEILTYTESQNINLDDILSILFEFSIIGNLDEKDRWLFKYKDHDISWSPTRRLTIHFGLEKKLRIIK